MKTDAVDNIDFSLVTGTLGRIELLREFLASLREQSGCTFELILVDQSPDGLPDHVIRGYDFPIRVFRRPPGLSACRNFGMKQTRGNLVAFPDDDCVYPAGLLASLKREFEQDPGIMGISTIVTDRAGHYSAGGYMALKPCLMSRRNIWRTAVSPSLFFRREAIENVEFDERLGAGSRTVFGSGEETDFCLMLLERGFRLEYMPQYRVYHPVFQGPWNGDRAWRYGCGFGAVLRKHDESIWMMIRFAGHQFARGVQRLFMGRFAHAGYHFRQGAGRIRGYFLFEP